jgi:hypothetical protein
VEKVVPERRKTSGLQDDKKEQGIIWKEMRREEKEQTS